MEDQQAILKATHFGKLNIGEKELTCAVLEDGSRIISRNAIFKAFGRTKRGRKKGEIRVANMPELPSFIDANNLAIYINGEIRDLLLNPVIYKAQNGREVTGYKAQLIPLMCDVYLAARMDNVLTKQQENLAIASEILVRSLSKLGIVALVDEATGYQADRDRDELQKLLSKYISKELLPWTKRFPDEFYQELFRLRNWDYPTASGQRPGIVGHYTNQFVYNHLPPGVKDELQRNNPSISPGRRKWKHHQFLSEDIGNVHLEKHLIKVITLMQASDTWNEFIKKFNRVFGVVDQMELDFDKEA
ncbi:P63C domain-containing protein [Bacillus albus]|uniref:P63C domain-containing protein n=1 Tax=Bacillus albus TaxID=2026189 RepID=UPI00141A38F0|nr:P63C domain-containing protein [Bacillus albus]MBU5220059.1 P63C domain-containing protein [Bacillus albus]